MGYLGAPVAHDYRHDVEPDLHWTRLPFGQPARSQPAKTGLFDRSNRFGGQPPPIGGTRLHLAENHRTSPSDHQIDLSLGRPVVAFHDGIAGAPVQIGGKVLTTATEIGPLLQAPTRGRPCDSFGGND